MKSTAFRNAGVHEFAMNQRDVKMRKCTAGCCDAGL